MPVFSRATWTAWTSAQPRGPHGRAGRAAGAAAAAPRRAPRACSSTSVFHSPQPGQRPCHFVASWPQALQVKTVAGRAIRRP